MFSVERWEEVFETLKKNKLRTFLTGLSVASGIFILVILLGFSTAIKNGVSSQFEEDAANRVLIRTGRTTKGYKGLNPGRYIQLKNDDFSNISSNYDPFFERKSASYFIWGGTVNYKEELGNYRIQGVYPDHQFIENASITYGRFLNQSDMSESKKVVVIGNVVKNELFKKTNPIGKYVSVMGINFKVVGVFTDPGGEREESRVFVPLSAAQIAFNGADNIRSMTFTVGMQDNLKKAVAVSNQLTNQIENDIKLKYFVDPEDQGAVRIYNTMEEAQKIYSLIDTVALVFWFVGLGTIIAGVVGVGNIMLIIVKERTKEIGIRKALGATPISIIGMILQEAIFVTMFSGFFGLILGLSVLEIINPFIDNDFIKHPQVHFATALTTVFVLVISGVFAGFIPAYKAAKIKPIIALRHE